MRVDDGHGPHPYDAEFCNPRCQPKGDTMTQEPRPQALKVLDEVPDNWPSVTRGVKRQLPKFENVSPTYVIRVSRERGFSRVTLWDDVATSLRDLGQGADILEGIGIWEGDSEASVTVIVQATDDVLRTVLSALARVPGIRWAHVEKHDVPTSYVDLETWR